ncbi:hypothetical protein NX794_00080 [Streptomyces sp. LP11]|uniref:Uncharacterized protein n=1 Tax=Streptomyces pyxinicus TaxID=2970331 RepID=A0ABT2ATT6_9ACTN|nr:hypothetical protein [Streptomyces sp. LP11]MCS0599646.1 hypothetical protein [Streptomyces sp. LP11]
MSCSTTCGGRPSRSALRTPPGRIAELLRQAGFALTARLVLEPAEGAERTIATFLAHTPPQADRPVPHARTVGSSPA